MSTLAVHVLGVYRIPFDKRLFRKAWELKYGYPMPRAVRSRAEASLRAELSSIALIEVLIQGVDNVPDIGDFHQPRSDQVAYDEHFFSPDGQKVIAKDFARPPRAERYRVGFFLHFYDPSKPLATPWGIISAPQMTELPGRLAKLMPYEPVG